jgi:hypothetical protein
LCFHRLAPAEGDQGALGAPTDGAREVRRRGGAAAAGEDEFLERRQGTVPSIELYLQRLDLGILEERVTRNRKLSAEVEQIVLHLLQQRSHVGRNFLREHQADGTVQLVDVAERGDARAVLRHPGTVAQAGLAGVAGAGGDLREAMAHQEVRFASLSTSPCARRVRNGSPGVTSAASRSTAPFAP